MKQGKADMARHRVGGMWSAWVVRKQVEEHGIEEEREEL